jgi:hypothetical protein
MTSAARSLRTAIVITLALVAPLRGRAQAPATDTLSFPPVADTFVDAGTPTKNYNNSIELKTDAQPVRIIYLRFAVAGLNGRPVLAARVRLGCTGGAASGGAIHRITSNTWDEAAINYNTRPAVDGSALQTLGAVAVGQTVEFNLDGAITADGIYSFAIDTPSTDGVIYTSAAATTGLKPSLVLTVPAGSGPNVEILQPSDSATFFVGDSVTLQASAIDDLDGNVSSQVAWTSSLQGPLGNGATIARQLIEGSHQITAAVSDSHGNPGSDTITLSVVPAPPGNTEPLVTISAPAPGPGYMADAPVSFAGTANDLEDGNLTATLAWTSDRDGALGTGASFARTLSPGTHVITARAQDSDGAVGQSSVTITVAAPTTVEFTAVADAYVDSGSPNTRFGATNSALLRADANVVRISYLRFDVAGLGSRRVARAVLRLQADAVSGAGSDSGGVVRRISNSSWVESTVTYNTRPTLDGAILATAGAVALGQVVDFDVTSGMAGDGTYDFAISNNSTDGVDYRSREGGPAPRLIVTLAGNAPVVAIVTPANQSVFFKNATIGFSGNASDAEDGDLSSGLVWTSSLDGVLGTGSNVSTSALRIGTHTISAAVTDSDGDAGQGQVSIRVRGPNAAPSVTIAQPAAGGSVAAGTPIGLAATATDDFDGDLSAQIHWTATPGLDLGIGATRTVTLPEGPHTITATVQDSDGVSNSASIGFSVTPTSPAVAIAAPADGALAFLGAPLTFTGSASDATDGDLTTRLIWTSNLDGEIGRGGSFTTSALRLGQHTITASATDNGGRTGQATHVLTIRMANGVPSVAIQAPLDQSALLSGKPVQLAGTASDFEDGNLTASLRWSSNRDGVLGTGGTLTISTLSAGAHILTAMVTDRDGAPASASVNVTVFPSTLTIVASADTYVDSGKPTTKYGTETAATADGSPVKQIFFRFPVTGVGSFAVDTAVLRLTVGSTSAASSNRAGNVHLVTNDTWTEAATTYNTRPAIDGPMLASKTTAVAKNAVVDFDVKTGVQGDGSVNLALVTTSSDDVIYQTRESSKKPQLVLTLKNNTPPTISINAPATDSSATFGEPVTLVATATDAENGNLASRIAWTSSLDGALGNGGTVTKSNLSPGKHMITAQVADTSGATAEATITLVVGHPPVVSITSPANGAVFFTSQLPIALAGTASDVEDGPLSAAIRWTSSLNGALGMGTPVSAGGLTIGTHVITAQVTDASGITRQASVTIRVRGANVAPAVIISAPTTGGSTPAGTSVTLTASASDDFDGDLSAGIRWRSSLSGDLFTGPTGTRVLAEGAHTLIAEVTDSDGVVGSAQIGFTVSPTPPVVTIAAPAAGALIFAGNSVTFTGTASDVTQGDLSASLRWFSSLDGQIGTGASFSTVALSQGSHLVTASVTDASGLTGAAHHTVLVRPPTVPPVVTIDSPADDSAYLGNRAVLLAGSAVDEEDGNLSDTIRWTSSRDGFLGTGASLSVATLSAGTHVITASVTDLDEAPGSASVSIIMTPTTIVLTPVADTWVSSEFPDQSFGGDLLLEADASPASEAYLRFQVDGMGPFAIESIVLRMKAGSTSSAASASGGTVRRMTNTVWSETTTTWNTRPVIDGAALGSVGAVAANQVVDFDLTGAAISNGPVSFGLVTTNSDSIKYRTREETSGRPELRITFRNPDQPHVNITAPATGMVVQFGQAVAFAGTATSAQNADLSAGLTWNSSIDGAIGTGPSFSRVLTPGLHTVTASVTDSGQSSTASVTVDVRTGNGVGFKDFTYPSGVEDGQSNEATAQKPESKLWWLDNTWWSVLYRQSANAHRIHRLDAATQQWIDTGVSVDERQASRVDVLVDGTKIYMTSRFAGSPAQNRLYRFTYDFGLKRHLLDPGFPVDLPGGGSETLTIAKDSTGMLWISYPLGSKPMVSHTIGGDDTQWAAPFMVPVSQGTAMDSDDITGIITLPGKIGVFWSNQRTQAYYFALHTDGTPTTSASSWTEEFPASGNRVADDHFNMKVASDGRLFVGIKTSLANDSDISVGLLVRSTSGSWSPLHPVARFDALPTRPLVVLDELHRRIYYFYSAFHDTINYKISDMDTVSFADGVGTPFITSASVRDINNPQSAKQNATPASGILVIASSRGDLSYWHNSLPIAP